MSGWPPVVLLTALCCGTALGLTLIPNGCQDADEHGAVVIRGVGEVWTKPGCVQGECQIAPGAVAGRLEFSFCSPPPFADCQVKEAGNSSAEFPACCPEYRCPGRCFSAFQRRWFEVGERWTEEGCQRGNCFDTDSVGILPCGLIAVEPPCTVVPGDPNAEYPACCHKVECEEPRCYDEQLDRHFAVGESWTLSGCSGQATCGPGGSVAAVGCPLEATNTPGCSLDDGDLRRGEYPQCCPKITCQNCHSQRLDRYFGPGDTWTGSSCTENVCDASPFGANVRRLPCGLLAGPPFYDCEIVGEDVERGDYPQCCSFYRCPGRCFDNGVWHLVGDQWDDGCLRAICIGTDRVERLTCPLLRLDPSRTDCRVVEGNSSDAYPACCSTVECDTPLDECRDAAGNSRPVGTTWTDPGCVRSQCQAVEGGVAVTTSSDCPPPPSPDCYPLEGVNPDRGEFPFCCPTYRCPERCYSPTKERWFSVGEEWTEDACILSVCLSTGQVRQAPCPFISARRFGCSVVPGDLAAEYPGCCHQVRCRPNPYG